MNPNVRKGMLYLAALLLLVLSACAQNTSENLEAQADAPRILFARATSDSTVLISFSDQMSKSAASEGNYSFTPALNVSSIKINDDDSRLVTLTTSKQTGDTYTVVVKNVETLAGDSVGPAGLSARFKGGGSGGGYSPIIPETTKVLDSSDVVKYSKNLMQLSDDNSLEVGDIVVSGPIEGKAPYGFLHKVRRVTSVGKNTLVLLEEGSLEEAVEQGELEESFALTTDDIVSSTEGNNVFIVEDEDDELKTQRLINLINIRIDNEVLCDSDGNRDTTDDQTIIYGRISASLEPFTNVRIRRFSLRSFEAGIEVDTAADIKVSGECDKDFEEEKLIETINFRTFVLKIGPVPVVVAPSIEIYIGYDGELSFETNFEIKQEFNARYGTRWDNGSGWSGISEVTSSEFDWGTPEFEGSINFKSYVGAKSGLKFYGGLAFTYVDPKVFAEASAESTLPDPGYSYCLYGGLDVDAGARVRILRRTLGEWDTDLYETRKEIECGEGDLSEATLTVRVNKGSVTALGQTCTQTSPCRLKVAKGSTVTLTRSSGDFNSWNGASCSPTALTCEVTVDTNKTVSANFAVRLAAKIELRTGDVAIYVTKAGSDETMVYRHNDDDTTYELDLMPYLSGGDDVVRIYSIKERYGILNLGRDKRDVTVTILVDGQESDAKVGEECRRRCESTDIGEFLINTTTGEVRAR